MNARPRDQTDALPPLMRASVCWGVGISVLFAVAAVAWVVLRRPLGLPRGGAYRYVPLAFGLVPILVVLPVWLWRTRRIRRAALALLGRLCTHCGYSMSGLPETGMCPECGNRFDLEGDRGLWENVGAHSRGTRPLGVPGVEGRLHASATELL